MNKKSKNELLSFALRKNLKKRKLFQKKKNKKHIKEKKKNIKKRKKIQKKNRKKKNDSTIR